MFKERKMVGSREAMGAYPPGRPAEAYGVDYDHPVHVVRRISPWAVLAGAVVGVVVLFLLGLLGLAVGLATIDPAPAGDDTPGAGTFGTGAAIWGIISFLIALLAAGWIASRLAGDPKKLDGLLHGVVAWALTTLIIMWLMTTTVSSIIGGAFSLLGNIASASAQAVQAAAGGESLADAAQQLPWDRIRQRVEQALPADVDVDRETLMAAFRELVLEGGDRQAVVDILVQQGGMAPEEAERTLQNLEAEYQQAAQQVEQQAGQAAQAAAETVSSAALWSFIALLLGGLAAAGGGWLGAPRDEIAVGAAVR
jgi:polyhydroxyalkanoate synthesis regulator phasin